MYSSWTTMPEAAQETLTLRFRVFHRGNCSPSSLEVAHFFASTRRDRVETILRQLPQQLIRARRSFEDARATGERAAAIIGTSRYLSIRCPQSIADASWPASAFSAAPSASTWARGWGAYAASASECRWRSCRTASGRTARPRPDSAFPGGCSSSVARAVRIFPQPAARTGPERDGKGRARRSRPATGRWRSVPTSGRTAGLWLPPKRYARLPLKCCGRARPIRFLRRIGPRRNRPILALLIQKLRLRWSNWLRLGPRRLSAAHLTRGAKHASRNHPFLDIPALWTLEMWEIGKREELLRLCNYHRVKTTAIEEQLISTKVAESRGSWDVARDLINIEYGQFADKRTGSCASYHRKTPNDRWKSQHVQSWTVYQVQVARCAVNCVLVDCKLFWTYAVVCFVISGKCTLLFRRLRFQWRWLNANCQQATKTL